MIIRKSNVEHPLTRDPSGRHVFGGKPFHRGITPRGADVPTHRLFVIDLADPELPFDSPDLQALPLYYPLKYGMGGPGMQYRVLCESEIEIIHITNPEPDPEELAYVKVTEFPECRFRVFPPISDNWQLTFDVATLGGTLDPGQDEPCRNPSCPNFGSPSQCELVASIPPIPIEGHDDIWWEYEGGYLFFHFWYCRGCDTIITANRCT